MLRLPSFLVVGVHTDGDGAVVDERHLHVGAKFARSDALAERFFQLLDEVFVERNGDVVTGGVDVGGAVAFLIGGHECELADHQNVAVDIDDAAVHDVVFVVEHPQANHFFDESVGILLRVAMGDAKQNHIALADA